MSKDKNGKIEDKKVDDKPAKFKVGPSTGSPQSDSPQQSSGQARQVGQGKEDKAVVEMKQDMSVGKEDKDEKKSISGEIKGLEELPEDIRKKLEKKKAGNEQKSKKTKVRKKKKAARNVSVGKAYIKATYNNTIVTLTDLQGDVIAWGSAGMAGFRGPKKSTPYAAQIITRLAVGKAREEYGLKEVSVFIKGVGTGREAAVRALNSNGLNVTLIKDVTPMPHNGCRVRRPRRV